MAAGTWKVYTRAKRALAEGGITLGSGIFRLSLHSVGASANILQVSNGGLSTFTSIGSEHSVTGGYTAAGRAIAPAAGQWTASGATTMKFTYTASGLVFTASGANLTSIKYAAIHASASAGGGPLLCFVTLSTTGFDITDGNTLTISPAAGGVFTLA